MPGVPTDANALAGLPTLRDVPARGFDHADHLVPRDGKVMPGSWPSLVSTSL